MIVKLSSIVGFMGKQGIAASAIGIILLTSCNAQQLPSKGGFAPGNSYSDISNWLKQDFSPEKAFLFRIRTALANNGSVGEIPDSLEKLIGKDDPAIAAVTLFQSGNKQIRWISSNAKLQTSIDSIVKSLRNNPDFEYFDISNPNKSRIMLEIITSQYPLNIENINDYSIGKNRFEPGITGFKVKYNKKTYFYMPSDATIQNHLSIQQALSHIVKKTKIGKKTDKIGERIELLKNLGEEWQITEGIAFISSGSSIIPMYRGYPQLPETLSKEIADDAATGAVDWILNNMTDEGKFLYYYDGANDNYIDHEHPNRDENNRYYNILRHASGIITMLKRYEISKEKKYLDSADKALEFLILQIKERSIGDKKAYYVFFNNKSKLGGSGLALISIAKYYAASNDDKYNNYAIGLARHILSQIDDKGEMQGYYIHPGYNNGEPMLTPTSLQKKEMYSPYYPGEALMGLALFDSYINTDGELSKIIRSSALKAMDYLVIEQPKFTKKEFIVLPNDSWLMQAIHEWRRLPEFQKKEYSDYVFMSTNQMMKQQYTEKDAPYYDYVGGFYYFYGEHVFPDAARGEGLIDAYFLAKELGETALADKFLRGSKELARNLLHTRVTDKSSFFYPNSKMAIGAFRFKLTRHWLRIDIAAHNAAFFMNLVKAM